MSSYTNNSLIKATELLSPMFINASDPFRSVMHEIAVKVKPEVLKNVELLNKLNPGIYSYLLATEYNPL